MKTAKALMGEFDSDGIESIDKYGSDDSKACLKQRLIKSGSLIDFVVLCG